jgi:hypothetical protein
MWQAAWQGLGQNSARVQLRGPGIYEKDDLLGTLQIACQETTLVTPLYFLPVFLTTSRTRFWSFSYARSRIISLAATGGVPRPKSSKRRLPFDIAHLMTPDHSANRNECGVRRDTLRVNRSCRAIASRQSTICRDSVLDVLRSAPRFTSRNPAALIVLIAWGFSHRYRGLRKERILSWKRRTIANEGCLHRHRGHIGIGVRRHESLTPFRLRSC